MFAWCSNNGFEPWIVMTTVGCNLAYFSPDTIKTYSDALTHLHLVVLADWCPAQSAGAYTGRLKRPEGFLNGFDRNLTSTSVPVRETPVPDA